ncbi:MAG: hypothetical protein H5U07_11010 [Candidatus Aminicenantes bacterium]|nr:hypothetical protein [Candidatus Aminicenantes bacterium]
MRRNFIFMFLLISSIIANIMALYSDEIKKEKLVLSKTFPEERVYFKSGPNIAVDEAGNIYAVDNREHMVFKFSPDGKLLGEFGGQGQGPGELQFPYCLSISKNLRLILVQDNIGISFFSEDGLFIKRFRVFSPVYYVCAGANRIYLLQPREDKLIHEYDYNGKWLKSFGRKYKIDYSIYIDIPPIQVDRFINEGAILSNGNFIYFISYLLGDIFMFNLEGEDIGVNPLTGLEGKQKNEKIIYKEGLERNSDGSITTPIRVVQAASSTGNDLFLFVSGYAIYGEVGPGRYSEIWKLSSGNLSVIAKYILPQLKIYDFCVLPNQKEDIFYVSFLDEKKEEFLIGLLKKEAFK